MAVFYCFVLVCTVFVRCTKSAQQVGHIEHALRHFGQQALRLGGTDALAVRASKKLRSDELLVTNLGATILRKHLDDAIALVKAIQKKPKLVVLSHIGPAMLRANLFKQEKILADATKCRVISASDFMELDLDALQTKVLKPVAKF